MQLVDKVAFITGGGSGIGRAVALQLARNGAAIAVLDRNLDAGQAVVGEIEALGGRASAFALDVADSAAVNTATAQVLEAFGQIDILVHCAGIAPQGSALSLTDEAWHRGIAVNLDGAFYVARAVGKAMQARQTGTMVFLASDRGIYGGAKVADYAAAKGGLLALAKSLALELAPAGVTVNAINPGTTDTPLARGNLTDAQWVERSKADPLGRFSKPEEIAEIVLFLAATAGQFMTGQLITTRMRNG